MQDTPIFNALIAEHPVKLEPPKEPRRLFLESYVAQAKGMRLVPLGRSL